MPHGLRGRVGQVAAAGLGVVFCAGLAGCLNPDKPKPISPPPVAKGTNGVPGAPGMPGATSMGKTGGSPFAPPGGMAAGRTNTGFPGVSVQPSGVQPGGVQQAGFQQPAASGFGAQNYDPMAPAQRGNPGTIGTPTRATTSGMPVGGYQTNPYGLPQPGTGQQPGVIPPTAGVPMNAAGSTSMVAPTGGSMQAYRPMDPPSPTLTENLTPPGPPSHVVPPVGPAPGVNAPLAPVAPLPPAQVYSP